MCIRDREYPPLIWRKNFTTASVFAVIGDYMTDATGLGMLTAMLCEMQSYTVYPVCLLYTSYGESCRMYIPLEEEQDNFDR